MIHLILYIYIYISYNDIYNFIYIYIVTTAPLCGSFKHNVGTEGADKLTCQKHML